MAAPASCDFGTSTLIWTGFEPFNFWFLWLGSTFCLKSESILSTGLSSTSLPTWSLLEVRLYGVAFAAPTSIFFLAGLGSPLPAEATEAVFVTFGVYMDNKGGSATNDDVLPFWDELAWKLRLTVALCLSYGLATQLVLLVLGRDEKADWFELIRFLIGRAWF